MCNPQKRSSDMRELLPSWKRCGGIYWKGETTIAKKEIGLVCWKRTRHSCLWFVVLHLPLDLNAAIMFSISTSRKTSSYMLWAPNQGPWVSLMMEYWKEWLRTLDKNAAAIVVLLRAQLKKNIPAALLSASEYAWMRGCRRELHTRKKIWGKASVLIDKSCKRCAWMSFAGSAISTLMHFGSEWAGSWSLNKLSYN